MIVESMIVTAADSADVALLDEELVKQGFWNSLVRRSKVLQKVQWTFNWKAEFQDKSKATTN